MGLRYVKIPGPKQLRIFVKANRLYECGETSGIGKLKLEAQ